MELRHEADYGEIYRSEVAFINEINWACIKLWYQNYN